MWGQAAIGIAVARRLSEIRADLKLTRARAVAAKLLDKAPHGERFMELTIEAIDALCAEMHRLELGGAAVQS